MCVYMQVKPSTILDLCVCVFFLKKRKYVTAVPFDNCSKRTLFYFPRLNFSEHFRLLEKD